MPFALFHKREKASRAIIGVLNDIIKDMASYTVICTTSPLFECGEADHPVTRLFLWQYLTKRNRFYNPISVLSDRKRHLT